MQILEHIPLKGLTTMKVGGNARFFVSITSESELEEALQFSAQKNIPFFVLGGGSNIVISDEGFNGLVIKNEIKGFKVERKGETTQVISIGAGESWDKTVEKIVGMGLSGIENLSFIPGTVGAAPVQNIGAYGSEIKDVLEHVRAYDSKKNKFVDLSVEECDFSYRNSLFKKEGHYIITMVSLRLENSFKPNLAYKDIQNYIDRESLVVEELTPTVVRDMIIQIRTSKLPDPVTTPTAGSFFKNPEVTIEAFNLLQTKYPEMPGFITSTDSVKIPLAWIIENICLLKGVQVGGASIYSKHALVIVNEKSEASASDISMLAAEVIKCVEEKTGIRIEREVQFIGGFKEPC